MKYIVVYKAKRKNAKRHVHGYNGRTQYFDSIEEAKACNMFNHPMYVTEVLTANYRKVEE